MRKRADASSTGASGLINGSGGIGTGGVDQEPGPLHVNLGNVVNAVAGDVGSAFTNELANLDLRVGVTGATASQAAPAPATGDYTIADARITFTSPTVAGLSGAVRTQVGNVQTVVDGLDGTLTGALNTLLGALGLVSVTANVDSTDLTAVVDPLLTGPITDPNYPGVTLDLSTGLVQIDLAEITTLEGLAPNTDLLTDAVINDIGASVTGIVTSFLDNVQAQLTNATNNLGVTASAALTPGFPLPDVPILSINSTVGQLLAGDITGVQLLGVGGTLPGGVSAVVAALASPLGVVSTAIDTVETAVIAPVVSTLVPALKPVLNAVLTLTANNQSTSGGVFTETALRATVLPGLDALTLNVANASVGPNAQNAGPVAPVISSLTPTSGPTAGGTSVTITGTGFTGTTAVTFDGVAAASFTVVSDTEITATTPAHAAGPVDVVVTSPDGASAPGVFTYVAPPAAPVISSLTPDSGPTTGGTSVTITGTGFTGATGVTFDGAPGTDFVVVDDTTITVTTPAGAAGPADVVVTSPNGDSAPGEFTYVAPPVAPTISSLTPTSGPTTGGTSVTITGTGFTGATGVTFGGAPGTDFVVVDDETITVTTPAGAAGPVDVVVESPNGDSEPGLFTYVAPPAAPVISSLTPTSGPTFGLTSVTITGTGFTGATGVTFDGATGILPAFVDDTTIIVLTPPHPAGPVDVVVLSPNGDSLPGVFTYVGAPVIASLTPTSGPTAGGTVVDITGSGFTGATNVTFGGAPASFTVNSDSSITATTPANPAGPVAVVVTGAGGTSLPGVFTYVAPPVAPTISSLTPTSGPTAGGTVVTITGTGFTGATGVTFDGAPGTAFEVVDDETITVTTPAGAAGPADVVVQSPNGDSTPGAFTYVAPPAAPVIASLTPTSGPTFGLTSVTITGTGFTSATGVTFDGTPGILPAFVDDTTIIVLTPPHPAGPVDVVVQSPNGDSLPGVYTYVAPPTPPVVSSLTPTSGPTAGGTSVTITGTGFTGATGVTFDGAAGTAFSVVDDTTITVTTPAGAAGPADVVVLSPNGSSLPGVFTYIAPPAAPTISSLTPTSGPTAGGTVVTITGTGFTGATGVTFDGAPGTAFEVVDDETITVTTPAGAAGPADVVVQSPNGDSEPGAFTYVAPPAAPVISSLTPPSGPIFGLTSVTITGTGFTGATGVTFDGTPGILPIVLSDTTISVFTPAHPAGPVDVVVLSPNGDSAPAVFTYIGLPVPPVVSSLTPTSGPTAGGTSVTITGTGFTGATGVTFDGAAGTAFSVVDDTTITVTTPAGAAGPADVVVLSPNGSSLPGVFTYIAPPSVSSLTPDNGPTAGGTVVTIEGSGFTGATGVTFDGAPGTSFSVVNDETIIVTTPAGAAGPADVVVQSPNGDSDPEAFTYVAPPAISSLTPTSGPTSGGTVVTISGSGFTGATGVTFDGAAGTAFSVVDDTTITVTTPAGAAGPADVVVQSPYGASTPGAFTYLAPAATASITPDNGPIAGGTVVTITGSGFTGATGVTFDGAPGTDFSVVDDSTIIVTTPAGAAGPAEVVVQSPNGDSEPGVFTYVAPPIVTGVSPASGPVVGGTVVTITGSGFTGATGVTFDGAPGTDFSVVDDTTIIVTTPAGVPGPADVVVQSPYGASEPGVFTYVAPPAVPMITSISPTTGPTTGGTIVTITGSGFTGATGVTFGGAPGTSFTVVNDTTITVTTPAGTAGEAAVVVLHENGNSEPGTFTYVTPPATPTGGDKGSRGLAVTGGDLSGMGLLALLALIPMLAGGVLLRRGRRTAS